MKLFLFIFMIVLSSCLQVPAIEEQKPPPSPSISAAQAKLLKIYFPYVGQGDATLIQLPSGKHLLIDTSNPQSAQEELVGFLQKKGIQSLSAVILSHYDQDHVGGLSALLEAGIDIQALYDRGGENIFNENSYTEYLSQALGEGLSPIALEAGDSLELSPQVSIQVLASSGQAQGEEGALLSLDLSPDTYSGQENASSLVLLIEYDDFRYLSGGDLTGGTDLGGFLSPDMESLVASGLSQGVDLVHANHHGSLSSSNEAWIEATQAQAVIIQAGINNFYGHPHPAVVQAWEDSGAEVYSTHGGLGYLVKSNGSGFAVEDLAD